MRDMNSESVSMATVAYRYDDGTPSGFGLTAACSCSATLPDSDEFSASDSSPHLKSNLNPGGSADCTDVAVKVIGPAVWRSARSTNGPPEPLPVPSTKRPSRSIEIATKVLPSSLM